MTKWEKHTDYDKTWIDKNTFFEEVIDNLETNEGNSENATPHHGLSNINLAV